MKAINKNHPSNSKDELVIWREIFNKIDTLLHYQLIICPYSALHEDESILANKNYTQDYQSLKSMYKHLAQWKHLPHTEEIERVQYFNSFKKYLWDKIDLPDWEATNWDDFHEWSDSIYLSVESWYLERIMDDIHTDKSKMHEAILEVYDDEWSKVKKTYKELYFLEMRAHGRTIYNGYARALDNLNKVNNWILNADEVMWSIFWKENWIFLLFYDLLGRIGITKKIEQIEEIAKFLLVSDLSGIQFIDIGSTLWAWIADLAYKGNISRKQLNPWMNNDVSAISHYLPYCDAMIVDWVIDNLLKHRPVKERISLYESKVFSWKKEGLTDFMTYLDWIYNNMTNEHKEIVEKVYWIDFKPYIALYSKK